LLDLRILNGTLVGDGLSGPFDIGIEGGQIAEIEQIGAVSPARAEIDATGLHLLPGAIDVHFHCRAPSRPERGDFASETAAAAAGGVTTVFEMPISDPACSTPEVFRSRQALASAQARVNIGLYSGAVLGSPERAAEMAELGAVGFKLFTVAPPHGRENEFAGLWATDEGDILESLQAVESTGLPCVVHAENDRLVRHFADDVSADGIPLRPPVIEATAVASVAALAKEAGARIHIAHVSSRAALGAFRAAIALGADVTGETCPQYLALDSDAVQLYGGVAKVAPPLRPREDVEALWEALSDGTLNLVASDHSPFLLHEKQVAYAQAPQGLPSVELLVPVLLDAAVRGRLPLESAIACLTSAPARRFGLYPRKGVLAVGADADLVTIALDQEYRPTPDTLVSRAAGCAIVFAGMSLRARVEQTVVNGIVVYDRGRLMEEQGGRFVPGPAAFLERV
jgi:dihydroorotase (multifunctional complex type)